MRPLAIDLFCGLGGWTEGLLAEGYRVVGFDIERHEYGDHCYPAQLVVQDVRTLHGSQFKDAALIVASPPCQAYSYRAMPWKRAKALPPPDNELFDACFRIQREASEAAGRHIPLIVENVRGAQKWVGRSRANFGSFHFWGDVPALMPPVVRRPMKVPGFRFDGSGRSFQSASVEGIKQGGDWFAEARKGGVGGTSASYGSKSPARKMASAMIAKIPLEVSTWIARCFKPIELSASSQARSISESRRERLNNDGRNTYTTAGAA
jgi:C-5 cytosine-specific DNA methylase